MIVTRSLTKRYGRVLAVDGVDLDVREGDRYGFLGPNGSGKTTVVRMLLGLVYATSGEIEVMGRPVPGRVAEVLPLIGSLVEGPSSYGHLSGRANLALLDASGAAGSRRTRRRRIDEALERVGMAGIDRRPVKKYSLGMRQRLGLAAALLRSPRLLVLDEPTNGLDPQGIREIRVLLTELNESGTTVFLSSHQLGEVEQLCSRVGVINRGRLVLQDDLAALSGPTGRLIVRSPDADLAAAVLDGRVEGRLGDELIVGPASSRIPAAISKGAVPDDKADPARPADLADPADPAVPADQAPQGHPADPADPTGAAAVNARLVAAGVRVTEIVPERRSLEQLVLAVTGAGSDRIDGADSDRPPGGADSDRPPGRPDSDRPPGRAVTGTAVTGSGAVGDSGPVQRAGDGS